MTDLSPDFYEWIDAHKDADPATLRLKYGKERAFEILQIECRKKYAAKLHETLARDPRFIFPTALAGEQSTSDRLAAFHASLIKPGMKVADLTAGLGIDAMAMARKAGPDGHVTAVERDENVADALRHNADSLPCVEVIQSDCRTLLDVWAREGMVYDCIFIDPARRAADGSRVYALDDCEPDVVAMMPLLKTVARRIIIKASPMLDITHTTGRLDNVERVIVLGSATECKELDIVCGTKAAETEPAIEAVTLARGVDSRFTFTRAEDAAATPVFGVPRAGEYIFDPYPAVMKAAPFRLLGARYGLSKLAANTQLWYGPAPAEGFPGRAYKIEEVLPYMSKHIKRYASRYPRVSVTARNFDMTADALRAKLRVSDGPARLFAATAADGTRYLITCSPA